MAQLGIATINVLARTTQFEGSLKRSIKRVGIATAAILGGVAAGNFLAGAIKNSITLEKQIKQIQTLLTDGSAGMDEMFNADAVRSLSNEIGLSATKVADSLYLILSSGIDAADAMDTLRAASNSAIATNSDLKQVVDFTTSALNAFGGETDKVTGKVVDAAYANDLLFKALQYGKGSMNDFAKYVSTAIPIADALGISLSEVATFAANNTLTGSSARKVFTGMKVAMQELADETKGGGKAFKELTGQAFDEFIKKGGTFKKAVQILGEGVGAGNLTNIFGAKEGAAQLQQTLTLWEQYSKVTDGVIKGAAGSAKASADLVNQSLSRQLDFLKTRFQNFQGSVGDWLAPVVGKAIYQLDLLGDKFSKMWPPIKQVIVDFVGAIGAVFATLWPTIQPAFEVIGESLMSINWAGIVEIIKAALMGLAVGFAPLVPAVILIVDAVGLLFAALNPIIGILQTMAPLIAAIAAGYAAWKVAALLVIGVEAARNAIMAIGTALTTAQIIATDIWIATTNTAAAAGGGFAGVLAVINAVMAANPFGIAVVALAALAGAFIYGWKTSEKFRNIVVKSWNTIKDATLSAIKVMFNVMFNYFTIPIKLIQKLIGAVGHLPKWLGGGVADDAAGAVNNIVAGIEHMKASLDGLIDKAMQADWALSKVYADDMGAQASADALKDPNFLNSLKPPKVTRPSGGGGVPNFSGNHDFGADDAANKAADAIKAAMKRIKADLDRIAKNTSKQTVDTIKNNFETLYKDMKDGKVSKQIINAAKKMEKQLIKLAQKRDKIVADLSYWRDELKARQDEADSFTKSIRDQVNALGDVSQATKGYAQTFTGIRNQLRYAVIQTEQFTKNIERLRQLNLNDTSLKQLLAAGPEAAGEAARILAASGAAGVNQINELQGKLTSAGNTLASSAYNEFFANGIAMAQGLVKGLESQQEAILKQMDVLGDRIAARFKKALGIKSPSKVFEGLGAMLPAGLTKGIDSGLTKVDNAGSRMVDASIHFGPGSVSVNGVADPKAAQRAGILAGSGIKGVLAQKKTDQALNGIG